MKLIRPSEQKGLTVPADMTPRAERVARSWYRHEGEIGSVILYYFFQRANRELTEARREIARLKALVPDE